MTQPPPPGAPWYPHDPAPQHPAPQYQPPQYQAPQYQAPQQQAPQYQAPQQQAPQYQAPQQQGPQYPGPQQHASQYPAPQSQAPPYPQGGAPGHGQAQAPAGAWAGHGTPQCRVCGCVPAAEVTFRGHRGMIVVMQFLHVKGPFCRDCGLSTFRDMTARTLIQGWYGYVSFAITPFTVLINLIRRGKVAGLPAPVPHPSGGSRRPLDPGAPLLARPMALIGIAIPVVLPLLIVLISLLSG